MVEMTFWKEGDYQAKGGVFFRSDIKDAIKMVIESGNEPVGLKIDPNDYTIEILVKVPETKNQ